MIVPKMLRRTSCVSPVPPQVRQELGAVPGSAPLPMHRSHATSRSTSMSRRAPNAASVNVEQDLRAEVLAGAHG